MVTYPALTDIEVRWRAAGSGVCIIVEGETEQEDPWFYQQWFGSEARRFTFFPQDGWGKVIEAVAVLRGTLGPKKVYGIIDRDFEPVVAYPPVPADGILRTTQYTLENYLLTPECWFKYVQIHTRRAPQPGWLSPAEAETALLELYRQCLPVSAYNWTLRQARRLNETAFRLLPAKDQQYREHPKSLANIDVSVKLTQLQTDLSLPDDLPLLYQTRLAQLQAMATDDWPQLISGKYVLRMLKETFPVQPIAWDNVLSAYMSICYDPPNDLATLLEIIWQDAHS